MKGLTPNLWFLVVLLLVLDQGLKVWVKTNMGIGESIVFFNWFQFRFLENNGFAFGLEFWGWFGKLSLTLFRLFFAVYLFRWLVDLVQSKGNSWVVFGLLLVFTGAVGNIIDSVFYGVFFGYAPLFFGKVVDMFYFPLISGNYPNWLPFFGGNYFEFFRYIFNIADCCITIGAVFLLFNYKHLTVK